MEQFRTLNAQQQPFIQSGYGAMGRLNTLLGLGSRPRAAMPGGGPGGLGGPGGQGMGPPPQLQVGGGGAPPMMGNHMVRPPAGGGMNPRLAQLLMLRAQNGDTEAQRMIG